MNGRTAHSLLKRPVMSASSGRAASGASMPRVGDQVGHRHGHPRVEARARRAPRGSPAPGRPGRAAGGGRGRPSGAACAPSAPGRRARRGVGGEGLDVQAGQARDSSPASASTSAGENTSLIAAIAAEPMPSGGCPARDRRVASRRPLDRTHRREMTHAHASRDRRPRRRRHGRARPERARGQGDPDHDDRLPERHEGRRLRRLLQQHHHQRPDGLLPERRGAADGGLEGRGRVRREHRRHAPAAAATSAWTPATPGSPPPPARSRAARAGP